MLSSSIFFYTPGDTSDKIDFSDVLSKSYISCTSGCRLYLCILIFLKLFLWNDHEIIEQNSKVCEPGYKDFRLKGGATTATTDLTY